HHRVIIGRTRVPWFNEEIKAERRWRDMRLDADLADFKQKRNWKSDNAIANIREQLDITTRGVSPFSDFNVLTEQEVSALIMSSSRKTSPTDPMPSKLSAYRKNHSTKIALFKITNDILLNMNKQHVTLLVVLDLSAAFDTIDQDILLDRMSTKLGIEGVVLKWFGSYLKGRSQRVAVHGAVSEKFDLSWGSFTGLMSWTLTFYHL
ncbi:Hypothetical predicted protein, partial [Paramuricea clavata]